MEEIKDDHEPLYHAIDAARCAQGEDTAAFLCFLSVRLLEMHRILKPTGAIYLHCDDAANAYTRTCMDAVFGANNFRNEIAWRRVSHTQKGNQYAPKKWSRCTDTIYYYVKSDASALAPFRQLKEEEIAQKFPHVDHDGRRYNASGATIFRSRSMGDRPNLCYEWRGFKNPTPAGWRLSKERLEEEYQKGNIVIRDDGKLERRIYAGAGVPYPA